VCELQNAFGKLLGQKNNAACVGRSLALNHVLITARRFVGMIAPSLFERAVEQ